LSGRAVDRKIRSANARASFVTVNELYDLLAAEIGTALRPAHGPAKAGEQMRSVLDGGKLRRRAGTREPIGLREGLKPTVESFRGRAGGPPGD